MKGKRLLALILSVVMVMAMAAACGSQGGQQTATTAPEETTAAPAQTQAAPAEDGAKDDEAETPSEEAAEEQKEEKNPTGEQILTIGVQADPGSMWAGGYPNSGKRTMRQLCYEALFTEKDEGGFAPLIGKDYKNLGNGKYEIEIFDNITDSKGNPLKASDVVFSIQKHVEDGQDDYFIKSIEAIDDTHIEVVFEPFNLYCFDMLVETPVFTEKAWNDSGDDMASEPVGTGCYKLTESSPGTSYTFERRDDYWQTDEEYIYGRNDAVLDKIVMKVITDTSAIAMALEKGEIDISPDIAAADYQNFIDGGEAKDGYRLCVGADMAFVRMDFNGGSDSLCSDENLRKAIAYAVDSEACGFAIHGDFAIQCLNATNPAFSDSDESLNIDDYYLYDPAKAKEYLDKSSYKGETLKMLVMPNKNVAPSATLIQQYLAAVGIKLELMQYEFAQYKPLKWESTGKEWDIQLQGVSSSDKYQYQGVEELGPRDGVSGDNLLYFHDEELEKLYLATADEEQYGLEATKALLDYNYEHCFLYGMYRGVRITVMRDFVHGVFPDAAAGSAVYISSWIEK